MLQILNLKVFFLIYFRNLSPQPSPRRMDSPGFPAILHRGLFLWSHNQIVHLRIPDSGHLKTRRLLNAEPVHGCLFLHLQRQCY